MANALAEYFGKQGLKIIEASLRHVIGKPTSYVASEAAYRMHVIQPGWGALPMPIRILMKKDFRAWDNLYQALKDETLDLSGILINLQPDADAAIARLVPTMLGLPGGAITVAEKIPVVEPIANPVSEASALGAPIVTPGVGLEAAPAVGIDLGTTFSLVAHVDEHGQPRSLPNLDGDRLTPSVVQFGDDGTVVGKQALLRSAFEPERTAICVKRDMGAQFYHQAINGEFIPPEVISAFILRSLKEDAARELGPILRTVITVPAYFDEARRRATVNAGRLAGLDVLDIINEPTAAAIAYGYQIGFLDKSAHLVGARPLRTLVFDLGGGTFDVTIVQIGQRVFKALATDGDVCLGGRDWDEKLVEIAAERFRAEFHFDPCDNAISTQELWIAAEAAKRTLSERPKATIRLNYPGGRAGIEVTRDEFEKATASLLERTRLTTEIVVRQARLTYADLDGILLVGGSTRMPMVGAMLETLTGKTVDRSVSPDEAVAHGAALYAQLLVKPADSNDESPDFDVTNVNSHSLGILGTDPQTGAKINKIVIPKNTPLPCTITMPFKTYRHAQRAVLIKVLEGDSEKPGLCNPVGVCTIANLPPGLPAGWPIEVSYTYQADGQLRLKAKLKGYAAGITMDFQHEHALPDEDVELWASYVEEELTGGVG